VTAESGRDGWLLGGESTDGQHRPAVRPTGETIACTNANERA
jgi:hypothetical protein